MEHGMELLERIKREAESLSSEEDSEEENI